MSFGMFMKRKNYVGRSHHEERSQKRRKNARVDVAFHDASQDKMERLAENVELLRTRVMVEKDRVSSVRNFFPSFFYFFSCEPVALYTQYLSVQVSSSDFPGHYPGMDLSWDLETFKKSLKIHINYLSETEMEFDLVGIDASIANAFRRILIAEVPTMAIEKVYIMNNTSIVQDEVLAHRLGMVPIKAHPTKFEFKDGTLFSVVQSRWLELWFPPPVNAIVINIRGFVADRSQYDCVQTKRQMYN